MKNQEPAYEPEIDDLLAAVAQGVINIDYGITTIEKDSRVYRGMVALCELRQTGRLVLKKEKSGCNAQPR